MNQEDGFLSEIQTRPDDDTSRLVYADWLEERGDLRSEFLRLDCVLARLPLETPGYVEAETRLETLARELDDAWLARVGERNAQRYDVVLVGCPFGNQGFVANNLGRLWGMSFQGFASHEVRELVTKAPVMVAVGQRWVETEAIKKTLESFDEELIRKGFPRGIQLADVEIRLNRPVTVLQSYRRLLPTPLRESMPSCKPVREYQPYHARIRLVGIAPGKRLRLIRAVRAVTTMGLLEARDFVDALPQPVMDVESRETATQVQTRLEDAGGLVSLEERVEVRENQTPTLEGGYPGLIALRASEVGLQVCNYGVRWTGPHTPVANHTPIVSWAWSQLPADPAERLGLVRPAVQEAMRVRQAEFRKCRYCDVSNPPEWMHGADVCQGCAERILGVVY